MQDVVMALLCAELGILAAKDIFFAVRIFREKARRTPKREMPVFINKSKKDNKTKKINTILENIEAYDGTAAGQKEVKQ